MDTKTFNEVPGSLYALQDNHSVVSLCGYSGEKGNMLLQWEHWLTLSGLVVLPQSVHPVSPSGEEFGMLAFMRTQKVLKSDALIVVTKDGSDGKSISPEDMQLIIIALHAVKRVYTTSYVGRHGSPDKDEPTFEQVMNPLRSLDLTAPKFLFELDWEDLRARDLTHKETLRIGAPAASKVTSGGSPTNGGTHGVVVASRRPTPSEPGVHTLSEELDALHDH